MALSNAASVGAVESSNERWTETGEKSYDVGAYHYDISYADRWNIHTTHFDDGTEQTVVHLVSKVNYTIYWYGNLLGVFEDKWQCQDIINGQVGNGPVEISKQTLLEKATTYYKPIQLQWVLIYANGEYRADHYFVKV